MSVISQFAKVVNKNERVLFASNVTQHQSNGSQKDKERILILTDKAIYKVRPDSNHASKRIEKENLKSLNQTEENMFELTAEKPSLLGKKTLKYAFESEESKRFVEKTIESTQSSGASGEPKIEDRRDSKSTRSEGDIKCSEKANVNAEAKKESDSKKANHKSSPGTSSGTSSGTSPGTSPGTSENNEDMDKEIHGVIPPVVNHQEEVSQEEGWKRIKRLKEITSNTKNAPLKIEEK
uniref:Uncharacterized protein n=1 Tax=Norrisiella sphaerica TaxID=552664 RepID=A0A7S2VVB5_9EUKA|mmetsp:Transcript_687/g.1011  ORF Transcript_687/g.1011 Transcript_687/m.1011 type:complete len:237 (+) Transcript_687:288-998(+)